MHRSILGLIVVFVIAGCGGGEDAPLSADSLVGEWGADFDRTWEVSREMFMQDTMRGADAYPDDPAEKEKIVHQEMKDLLATMVYTIRKDGSLTMSAMGRNSEGTWKLDRIEGRTLHAKVKVRGPEKGNTFRFEGPDVFLWTLESSRPQPTIVFARK